MFNSFFTSHSFYRKSKSRSNKSTIFSRPCCAPLVDPNCCTEEFLHSLSVTNFFKKKELVDAEG